MYGNDDDDDYEYRENDSFYRNNRSLRSRELSRMATRSKELTLEEVKTQGWALLKRIVDCLPNKLLQPRNIVSMKTGELGVRVNLKVYPDSVIDFITKAFQIKGCKISHKYNDNGEDYDYIVLTFPKDWHHRMLLIGEYDLKKREKPAETFENPPIELPST